MLRLRELLGSQGEGEGGAAPAPAAAAALNTSPPPRRRLPRADTIAGAVDFNGFNITGAKIFYVYSSIEN